MKSAKSFRPPKQAKPKPTRPPWSNLYNQRKWKQASKQYLAANPWCSQCGQPAEVTDHIEPHRGDLAKFWDVTNWQALDAKCHNQKTQKENSK